MRGSTTVGPLRDGESVFVGGVIYKLAQTVTNRRESTYENILTIYDDLANLVGDTFTCTVANILGMDISQSITISGEIHHLAYNKLWSISTHQIQVPYEYKYTVAVHFLNSSTHANKSTQ